MGSTENMEIFKLTLEAIINIYMLAKPTGLNLVRYLNHRQGKRNVTTEDAPGILDRMAGSGLTRLGTELHRRILHPCVLNTEMTRPLLIMIMTDLKVRFRMISILRYLCSSHELNRRLILGGGGKQNNAPECHDELFRGGCKRHKERHRWFVFFLSSPPIRLQRSLIWVLKLSHIISS